MQRDADGVDAYAYGYFDLMMRMYWPEENVPSVLDGPWNPFGVLQRTVHLQPTGKAQGQRGKPNN
ncbi:hypothetical protein [Pedosphaera parvula]|uniref:Uncharacterized protein n=1 Tax=Pedosphaera parvula (strain Ellin514) TaxID=320771 RepID=B9XG46_PEDPL|nr:hypothetical protein [Pedosphaera parvula]EEF61208.1 hypothetical protein Cflav_PD3925 [Pedosphaera parvula Ellin514]